MQKEISYKINDLMDECLSRYNDTYSHLLDTEDFVPERFTKKRLAFIFKQERKSWRRLKRAYKVGEGAGIQKTLKRRQRSLKSMFALFFKKKDNAEPTENVTPPSENEVSAGNVAQTENTEVDSNVEKREEK